MAGWDGWLSPSSDMCTLSSDPSTAGEPGERRKSVAGTAGGAVGSSLCSQSGRCLPPAMATWGQQPICHTWGFSK